MDSITVIAIIGYTGVGKDTYFNNIKNDITTDWILHKSRNYDSPQNDEIMLNLAKNKINRIAFADILKDEVIDKYGLNLDNTKNKDLKQYTVNNDLLSFRDLCIKHALLNKKQDPEYYAKKIIIKEDYINIITDLRFLVELNYLKRLIITKNINLITLRLYRDNMVIPDINIESEHELDNIETDYLCLLSNDTNINNSYIKLISKFDKIEKYLSNK